MLKRSNHNLPINLPRLYIDNILCIHKIIELKESAFHYLHHVLRKKLEDFLLVFDGKTGLWKAQITTLSKKNLNITIIEKISDFKASPDVHLYFAPLKLKRLDMLVEKTTELGVRQFCPIITEFTQTRDINSEKLHLNAIEASEQCERLDIPTFQDIQPLKNILTNYDTSRMLLFADETQNAPALIDVLKKWDQSKIDLLIGPEGGFSTIERLFLRSLGFVKPCHLGHTILRAETAAIFGLSCIMAYKFHGNP
jgi:16S rRNA (uracil1498-N3)-methyltransferase